MSTAESVSEINNEISLSTGPDVQQQQQQPQLSSPQRPTTLFTKFNNDAITSSLDSSRLSPTLATTVSAAAATTLSPNGSTSSINSPSAFPPEMPQWKKDLIQRRKTNVARTISATGTSPASSTTSSLAGDHVTDVLHTPTTPTKVAKLIASQYDTLTANRTAEQKMSKITTNTKKMPVTMASSPIKSPTSIQHSSAGGHYTPQVEHKLDINATAVAAAAAKTTASAGIPIEAQEEQNSKANTVFTSIPKQRSNLKSEETAKSNIESERATSLMTTRLAGFEVEVPTTAETITTTAIATTSTLQRTVEVFETQETETARKQSTSLSSNSSSAKCGTYAVNRQSHSKFDSERSLSSVNSTSTCIGKINSNIVGIGFNDGTTPSSSSSHSTVITSAVCDSEKTVYTTSSIGVSGNISNKLKENQFIKNQVKYQQQKSLEITTTNSISTSTTTTTTLLSPNSVHSNSSSSSSPSKFLSNNKKKMVAVQEIKKTTMQQSNATAGRQRLQQRINDDTANTATSANIVDFDPSEDLSYGPGIVSKLRCRYLSLALRESMEKQRRRMDNLRRATSLNNLLDRNDDDDDDDEEEDEDDVHIEEETHHQQTDNVDDGKPDKAVAAANVIVSGGILKRSSQFNQTEQQQQQQHQNQSIIAKKSAIYQKHSVGNGHGLVKSRNEQNGNTKVNDTKTVTENSNGTTSTPRHGSRHLKRGNDSLKRARSVEALLCEKVPWNFAMNRSSLQSNAQSGGGGGVTIEDKIHNARERLILGSDIMPPRRLTSIIDDTERPPPDLVKQTLKMFEATANRRGRGGQRAGLGGGEVANKVANYKSIIKEQKPAVVFSKPPSSPNKKLNSPIKKTVMKSADLLCTPIGLKTTAMADIVNLEENQLLVSTPKTLERTNGNGFKKLLNEQQEQFVTESPVTALTKKLEKLCIENEKQSMKHGSKEINNIQANTTSTTTTIATTIKSTAANDIIEGAAAAATAIAESNIYKKHVVGGGAVLSYSVSSDAVKTTTTNTIAHESSHHDKNTENLRRKNLNSQSQLQRRTSNDEDVESTEKGGENFNENNDDVQDFVMKFDDADHAKQQALGIGTAGSSSDQSDDEEYGRVAAAVTKTKRVTKTALENIAKAGTTQQYKFAGDNNKITNINNKQILNGNKIISSDNSIEITNVTQQMPNSPHELAPNSMLNLRGTTTTTTSGKQIGVIRPLLTTNQHQQLTSREIEKNRINELKKTAAVANANATTITPPTSATGATNVGTVSGANNIAGTSLDTVINTNSNNSLNKLTTSITSSPAVMATSSPIAGSGASGISELDATNSPLWALRKKRQTPPVASAENTTMVFNFRDREKVPDYIENDGVIFRRKRVLPKPNESGFVRLPDLSLETSTDSDYDDFSMCPPSPCDVQFENANIVIDGKSSIRQKSKEATFRVQFNDTLTSTFEYPSEASLIIQDSFDEDHYANTNDLASAYENLILHHIDSATSSPAHQYHHVAVDEIIPLPTTANETSPISANSTTSTKNVLGNLTLGSAPLGYYTPIKAPIDSLFQLGVTRAPTGNGSTSTPNNGSNGNGFIVAESSIVGINDDLNDGDAENGDEPESLQFIKPANDDLTIAYSETKKTDLLY